VSKSLPACAGVGGGLAVTSVQQPAVRLQGRIGADRPPPACPAVL